MPAPSQQPGVTDGPAFDPALLPVMVESGGSGGGGGGGLTPNQIAGISIAFGGTPSTEVPLWQNLMELGE